MDENEDMKKELRDLEEEIEEMQDNFRWDTIPQNLDFGKSGLITLYLSLGHRFATCVEIIYCDILYIVIVLCR